MSQDEPKDLDGNEDDDTDVLSSLGSVSSTFKRLDMTNFLSYKAASVEFGRFVALVGPNASGKSNAVSAIKLLHEVAVYGLPIALARRGGFDQLRHRSNGRPNDPALRMTFAFDGEHDSHYELKLGAVKGGRYRVKEETASVWLLENHFTMRSDGVKVEWQDHLHQDDEISLLRLTRSQSRPARTPCLQEVWLVTWCSPLCRSRALPRNLSRRGRTS